MSFLSPITPILDGSAFSAATNGGAGGGGAGGEDSANTAGTGGGGVGILGEAASGDISGEAGSVITGSGATNGTQTSGGLFGGGGGGCENSANVGAGGRGAVRIIWGPNRQFPSTNTVDNAG